MKESSAASSSQRALEWVSAQRYPVRSHGRPGERTSRCVGPSGIRWPLAQQSTTNITAVFAPHVCRTALRCAPAAHLLRRWRPAGPGAATSSGERRSARAQYSVPAGRRRRGSSTTTCHRRRREPPLVRSCTDRRCAVTLHGTRVPARFSHGTAKRPRGVSHVRCCACACPRPRPRPRCCCCCPARPRSPPRTRTPQRHGVQQHESCGRCLSRLLAGSFATEVLVVMRSASTFVFVVAAFLAVLAHHARVSELRVENTILQQKLRQAAKDLHDTGKCDKICKTPVTRLCGLPPPYLTTFENHASRVDSYEWPLRCPRSRKNASPKCRYHSVASPAGERAIPASIPAHIAQTGPPTGTTGPARSPSHLGPGNGITRIGRTCFGTTPDGGDESKHRGVCGPACVVLAGLAAAGRICDAAGRGATCGCMFMEVSTPTSTCRPRTI